MQVILLIALAVQSLRHLVVIFPATSFLLSILLRPEDAPLRRTDSMTPRTFDRHTPPPRAAHGRSGATSRLLISETALRNPSHGAGKHRSGEPQLVRPLADLAGATSNSPFESKCPELRGRQHRARKPEINGIGHSITWLAGLPRLPQSFVAPSLSRRSSCSGLQK